MSIVSPRRRNNAFVALTVICVLELAFGFVAYHLAQMSASPFVRVDTSTSFSGKAYGATFANIYDSASVETTTFDGLYDIDYCSEIVAANDPDNPLGKTSTRMLFDDAWFGGDGHTYNHDLACTSMILSAVVNSESQYYGDAKSDEPYVEIALEKLGFQDVDTSSFVNASKTIDEVGLLVQGEEDTVAYALAHKTLPITANDGAAYTLVFLGVRGTFGVEWSSNLRLTDSNWVSTTDHAGFLLAEMDVEQALIDYLDAHDLDVNNTKILLCGHSRGGSVTNLLARNLLDAADTDSPLVAPENLFTYTFAASANTCEPIADDDRYQSIYNVVNPTDLIPHIPLAAWEYRCYGTTVRFPDMNDDTFNSAFDAMQNARAANTGFINTKPYRYGDPCSTKQVIDAVTACMPTVNDLYSLEGVTQTAGVLIQQDLYRILASHFPDTYIAWMQSLDPQDLTFENAGESASTEDEDMKAAGDASVKATGGADADMSFDAGANTSDTNANTGDADTEA